MSPSVKPYDAAAGEKGLSLYRNGRLFLTLPAGLTLGDRALALTLAKADADTVLYRGEGAVMRFVLLPDAVQVEVEVSCPDALAVYETRYFTRDGAGIRFPGFDRAFTPQPRNNANINCDYHHHFPDISANGYHTPPILNFSIGSPDGWVSFGWLDIPDSKQCRLENDGTLLVESAGGYKKIPAGGVYTPPRILLTFPKDEWDGISLFREKLREYGLYTPRRRRWEDLPAWWKYPQFCTYGDQLIEQRVGQKIDTDWVRAFVDRTEEEYGISNAVICIDDSWQYPHSIEPAADPVRFPDLRGLIEELHARGHRVMLWYTPLFDKITNGFTTRAQRLGVLSGHLHESPYFKDFPGCYAVDYTHDNADRFLRETTQILFGDGEGQFHADAVKLDFIGMLRDPAATEADYAHPERGIGMRELYRFFELFSNAAHAVNPDVMVNATLCDPRFEHLIDVSRLHDTHSGEGEKETRARIMTLACPDLPVDMDGALMFPAWQRRNFTTAAICGIPANYYTLACGRADLALPASEKKMLGALMRMTVERPAGTPVTNGRGNWQLTEGGRVNAESVKGETVIYYPVTSDGVGRIFSFLDEVVTLPLHGRKFSALTPAPNRDFLLVDYARDEVTLYLRAGVIYTFRDIDDGTSIDRTFSQKAGEDVEKEVDYVNG